MAIPTSDETGATKDFVDRATEVLSTISAFWALLLCGIYLWDIIGREAFSAPFAGTHEIVANSIVGILFLELPSSIKRRAMIRTVFIFNVVSDKIRRTIDCSTYILRIILFAAIFELLFKHNNPKKVIISEYLLASEYFLNKVQIGYLNAILDKISKVIRKDEQN